MYTFYYIFLRTQKDISPDHILQCLQKLSDEDFVEDGNNDDIDYEP